MAINHGSTYAIKELALMYREGRGVPKDIAKVEELYRKAAGMGELYWLYFLGRDYIKGSGVPQDYEKGIALCQEAIAFESSVQKNPYSRLRACFQERYGGGSDVPQNSKGVQFQKKL